MSTPYQFKRSTPEAEGISSSGILSFVEALEQHDHPLDAVQGFMLLRHGNVVAEGWWGPYSPEAPHSLFSLSKSFTSTGIGLAVAEGRLSVDDPVLKFFPEDAPANPSENLKAMRVRHLLSMNTGHKEDTTRHVFGSADTNWPKAFLSLPVEYEPGTWFVYNTAATYMLSAIITKLTGMSLLDYLRPRLFQPLGIQNPTWETDPRGINIGGSGLHVRTEDIARFGQMYLQKGMWNGQRILPEAWVTEASAAHSDNSVTQSNPDWIVGYGYQFWRCQHNFYRGDGAFGQYCIVMDDQDAVLAITSGVRDMQKVLNIVWDTLLPAMQPAPLPADSASHQALCDKLAAISLPLPKGQPSSPKARDVSGKTYKLAENDYKLESVSIDFANGNTVFKVWDGRGEHKVHVGHGTWLKGNTDLLDREDAHAVAASGAWTSDDTYEARMCFNETELCDIVRCHFGDGELRMELDPNVSWGPAEVMVFTGRLAG